MQELTLSSLVSRLTDIQRDCQELIKNEILETESTLDKLQLRDMSKIIESDIKCRINLDMLSSVVPRIEFSDESYRMFSDNSRAIISYLKDCKMPGEISDAYKTVKAALSSEDRHSLQDVFTIISVIITAVALCLTGIPKENLSEIIKMLDSLLEIKERQLNLVTQMTKWRSDFLS